MTATEIKNKLLVELGKTPYGASTRHLCNLLFKEIHPKYIILPGNEKMKQVYGYLKTLSNQGKVKRLNGYWKLNA